VAAEVKPVGREFKLWHISRALPYLIYQKPRLNNALLYIISLEILFALNALFCLI
jgi:hypothetical protein